MRASRNVRVKEVDFQVGSAAIAYQVLELGFAESPSRECLYPQKQQARLHHPGRSLHEAREPTADRGAGFCFERRGELRLEQRQGGCLGEGCILQGGQLFHEPPRALLGKRGSARARAPAGQARTEHAPKRPRG